MTRMTTSAQQLLDPDMFQTCDVVHGRSKTRLVPPKGAIGRLRQPGKLQILHLRSSTCVGVIRNLDRVCVCPAAGPMCQSIEMGKADLATSTRPSRHWEIH